MKTNVTSNTLHDHPFYRKSRKEQKKIQLLIGLGALLLNALVFVISVLSGFYLLVFLSIAITLSVIAPFYDTPSQKESGKLLYYSSLFLTEKERNGILVVHGGTLFDYYFVLDRDLNGRQRTNLILQKYVEGLLNLIEGNQRNEVDELKIKGTSYILNKKTVQKAGFNITKTNPLQQLILIYNYVNLTFSISLAKAKLTFPDLRGIISFEADFSNLKEKKSFLENLNERLKRT